MGDRILSLFCQIENLKAENDFLNNKIKGIENTISVAETRLIESHSNEFSHVWTIIEEGNEEEKRLRKEIIDLKAEIERLQERLLSG
jgi:uncharacterized coiled-coil DUF342 family protein